MTSVFLLLYPIKNELWAKSTTEKGSALTPDLQGLWKIPPGYRCHAANVAQIDELMLYPTVRQRRGQPCSEKEQNKTKPNKITIQKDAIQHVESSGMWTLMCFRVRKLRIRSHSSTILQYQNLKVTLALSCSKHQEAWSCTQSSILVDFCSLWWWVMMEWSGPCLSLSYLSAASNINMGGNYSDICINSQVISSFEWLKRDISTSLVIQHERRHWLSSHIEIGRYSVSVSLDLLVGQNMIRCELVLL